MSLHIKITSVAFALMMSSIAHADAPDITGTWKGVSSAAVIGSNQYFDTEGSGEAKFFNTEFTIIIDQMNGQSFAGQVLSSGIKEPIVGTFKKNGKEGVMSDLDGTYIFEMLAPNTLELCYTHALSATGRSAVAACNELTR